MNDSYIFTSERLGFREWNEVDKIPFSSMNASPLVMEHFPNTLTREQSDAFQDRIMKLIEEQGYGLWAVEILETREFIGFIGFMKAGFEAYFTPCVEIGWRLDSQYWNRGYATEGAKACLQYGFDVVEFEEICSFTAQTNKPSMNVMKKIGMTYQGDFDHPKLDKGHPLESHVLYKIARTRS